MNVVKIIKDFIPKSNRNRPGYRMNPLYITVHNTANTSKGANAASHASLVKRSNTAVSWHDTVDENCIYQHLPLNENGWHAGDGRGTGNMKSIGIEICENAQWLIRQLMTEQGIPLANVVPHKRWSGKNCPRKLLNRWDSFKACIATAHTGKKTTAKPATPVKNTPFKPKASKPKKSFNLPSGILKVTKPLTKVWE